MARSLVRASGGRRQPRRRLLRLVVDIVVVTKSRTEVALFFFGARQAFPRSFEQVLVRRILARAA
jgi:hypothetical protein